MRFTIALGIILLFCLNCCKETTDEKCLYTLHELLLNDTPKVKIVYSDDSIIVVEDEIKKVNDSKGVYVFTKSGALAHYRFMHNDSLYRFSETYDYDEQINDFEGVPLLQYDLSNRITDSIGITISVFALNKQYEEIIIFTNRGDTIYPKYLFKNDNYTNVKCFSFTLPLNGSNQNLKLFSKLTVEDKCSGKVQFFRDTISFDDSLFRE
jgi:hypothetical protein